jgi:hypothetical protein
VLAPAFSISHGASTTHTVAGRVEGFVAGHRMSDCDDDDELTNIIPPSSLGKKGMGLNFTDSYSNPSPNPAWTG